MLPPESETSPENLPKLQGCHNPQSGGEGQDTTNLAGFTKCNFIKGWFISYLPRKVFQVHAL